MSRGHLQRLPEEPPPGRRDRQEARLRDQSLRVLPRTRQQARRIHVRRRYPQPAKLKPAADRQALPHLPSEPAHPRGTHQQQSCQEPGELRRAAIRFTRTDRTAWWRASRRKSTSSAPSATPTSGPASSGLTNTACRKARCRASIATIPHGSFLPRAMIQTANANEPGCFKCHGDKRGPFVFEHAPVQTGRLRDLPRAARLGQPAHADARPGALRLPGVPCQSAGSHRAGQRHARQPSLRRCTICAARVSRTAPSAIRRCMDPM